MTEKRKRGRPKGSGGKKKDWPELKNVTPKDLKAANKLVADSFMDAIASQLPESEIREIAEKGKGGKEPSAKFKNAKVKVEIADVFPGDWDKMGKVERLRWLKNKNL